MVLSASCCFPSDINCCCNDGIPSNLCIFNLMVYIISNVMTEKHSTFPVNVLALIPVPVPLPLPATHRTITNRAKPDVQPNFVHSATIFNQGLLLSSLLAAADARNRSRASPILTYDDIPFFPSAHVPGAPIPRAWRATLKPDY